MDKDILGAKQCVKLPVNLSFYYSCFSYDCFKMLVSPSCSWRSIQKSNPDFTPNIYQRPQFSTFPLLFY